MPRPKGSKNKVKSTNTQPIDFASLIAEKSSSKEALVADIASFEENLTSIREELKAKKAVFFASTFSSKMQIDFLKVAWGISPVLHFPLRHSFRCRRGAVAGIQSLLVTDM